MKATWILPDGRETTHEVTAGSNLMEAAVARGVPGIVGECGGSMSCATCHVMVDTAWFARTGDIGTFEDQMLDVTETERDLTSRLSCQMKMTNSLDGIILRVPQV